MLVDRGVSPGVEAVLQRRAVPGAVGAGATQSHRDGDPGVRAAVLALLHHGGQLVRDEDEYRARSDPGLSLATAIQVGTNCVTPISIHSNRCWARSPPKRSR